MAPRGAGELPWEYGGFALALLCPVLYVLFYVFVRRVRNVHAWIFGVVADPPLLRTTVSLCFLATAPWLLLLPVVVQYEGGYAWLAGGVGYGLALVVGVAVLLPVLHYAKSASVCEYLADRYNSTALQRVVAALLVVHYALYNVILLVVSAELAAGLLPRVPRAAVVGALGALAPLAVVVGGQTAVMDSQVWFLCPVAVLAMSVLIYRGVEGGYTHLERIVVDLAPDYSAEAPNWLAAVLFSIPVGLQSLVFNQTVFQHYSTQATVRRVRLIALVAAVLSVAVVLLALVWGVTVHGVTQEVCIEEAVWNPYTGILAALKHLWPKDTLFVGSSGLILAGFICIAPTIFATNLVAMTTVFWEDFMRHKYNNSKEAHQLIVVRMCLGIFACVAIVMTVLMQTFVADCWLYTLKAFLILAALSAPVTATYTAGILLPCTNKNGALFGLAFGTSIAVALSVGHMYFYPFSFASRPLAHFSTKCDNSLLTSDNGTLFAFASSPSLMAFTTSSSNASASVTNRTDLLFDIGDVVDEESVTPSAIFGQFRRVLESAFGVCQLYHTAIVFASTLLAIWLASAASGGQDVYLLDWNLVAWTTCAECGETDLGDLVNFGGHRRRNGGGRRSRAFVATDSFRYAHQAPPLPDNTCRNPKLLNQYLNKSPLPLPQPTVTTPPPPSTAITTLTH